MYTNRHGPVVNIHLQQHYLEQFQLETTQMQISNRMDKLWHRLASNTVEK